MLFAGSLLGPSAAVLAGLILCGSYQYVSQGRIGLVDMTLAFFETLALYAFFRWFVLRGEDGGACESRSTTVMHYVFAVATGLAVLAKGPVGMLMPGGAAIIFLLVHREWAALRDLIKVGPLIVGAVCASSWYLACLATGHLDFLKLQMGSENFGRFFGSLGSMPPWYYVQPILLNSLPLSLFVPMAVVCALWPQRRQGPDSGATGTGAPATLEPRGPAAWGINLLALFWIVSVAFFAIASYKRRNYLLPVWPAAAVLLAWWVIDYLPRGLRTGRAGNIYRVTVGVCLASAIANFVFIPPYELHNCGVPFNLRSLSRWPSAVFAGKSPSDAKQVRSYRAAAAAIDHLTDPHEPVYVIGIDDALEPLVFYLGRCARPLHSWRDLPAEGFIITTVSAWSRTTAPHSGWSPVAKISYGSSDLILLKIRRNETATTLNPAVLP
jgi:4-amino-4-deoxy-L-arabinose transferase-like glycosyltransferase